MTNHPNRRKKSKYPQSLVRSWLEIEQKKPGNTKAAVIKNLNAELGTSYQQGRLYEWLLGDREPERTTRAHMLKSCIAQVLQNNGVKAEYLSPDRIRAIAEALS